MKKSFFGEAVGFSGCFFGEYSLFSSFFVQKFAKLEIFNKMKKTWKDRLCSLSFLFSQNKLF
ncbi:MAG: hypothetical protein PHU31_04260 [Anaerotignum sp.]|nr:hypothetical protein [Anaerotignum sp.]